MAANQSPSKHQDLKQDAQQSLVQTTGGTISLEGQKPGEGVSSGAAKDGKFSNSVPGNFDDKEADEDDDEPHHLMANVLQMAIINKMLAKGFKFEIYDVVKRQTDIH